MKSALSLFLQLMFLRLGWHKSKSAPIKVNEDRPVIFPFQNSELHQGFVNSINNKSGMQAQFYIDDTNSVTCLWQNTASHFQGFSGIIHGGVLVALADELMANCLVSHKQKFGVTLSSRVQWKAPVKVGEEVKGRAHLASSFKKFVLIKFVIVNSKNQEVLTGHGLFYLPTQKQFKKMTGMDLPQDLHSYLRN